MHKVPTKMSIVCPLVESGLTSQALIGSLGYSIAKDVRQLRLWLIVFQTICQGMRVAELIISWVQSYNPNMGPHGCVRLGVCGVSYPPVCLSVWMWGVRLSACKGARAPPRRPL